MMRWINERANRERFEELVFSRKINKSDDSIIWFDQLNFISLHHHCILHAWTIRLRVASVYLRRFVSSILHQFVDFASSRSTIIQSRWFIQVEMISFIFIDFRNRREINEHEDEYTILMRSNRSDNEARRQLDQKKKPRDDRRSRFSEKSRWIMRWEISRWDCRERIFI
jgi:hypothetical protein